MLIVIQSKDLSESLSVLSVGDLAGHQVQELIEFNLSTAVLINFGNHLENALVLFFKTKRDHGCLELYIDHQSYP